MSGLYLYALMARPPGVSPGFGLRREALRILRCADVFVAAGEMREAPSLSAATLRGHDATVRRLARTSDAILPVRFGSLVANEAALSEALEPSAAAVGEALDLVRGREQMTLRVYGERAARTEAAGGEAEDALGPGAQYLARKRRSYARALALPEIEPLRPVLRGFVRAERIEPHEAPPLLASLYHLVERGAGGAYSAAVQEAALGLPGVRLTVSGPWAPYAFAPEGL